MKKIYMTPNTSIISVDTQQMIAGSILKQTSDTNAEVDVTTTEEGYGGTFGSNGGFSIWNDDDE